jgi:hypothetical protein
LPQIAGRRASEADALASMPAAGPRGQSGGTGDRRAGLHLRWRRVCLCSGRRRLSNSQGGTEPDRLTPPELVRRDVARDQTDARRTLAERAKARGHRPRRLCRRRWPAEQAGVGSECPGYELAPAPRRRRTDARTPKPARSARTSQEEVKGCSRNRPSCARRYEPFALNRASILAVRTCGFVAGAKRFTTLPLASMRNFVKFHFTFRLPKIPGAAASSCRYTG